MASSPASGGGGYSCETAERTQEWMEAIAAFLRRHRPLLDAHVVNFFKDRLWELVDAEWMACLRKEPVENLLKLPSGFVKDYWPKPLQEFVLTLRSLVLPREQMVPQSLVHNLRVASIGPVLAQGMNSKKKHEIEILAAVVDAIARACRAETIVDVGSGQGYLAQTLSFEYQHCIVAIDASSHHAAVTNTRAERIKKHYAAKCEKNRQLKVPRTVTCHVLSSDKLAAMTFDAFQNDHAEEAAESENGKIQKRDDEKPPLVLAGLHACGDLSVNMLRAFISCERVKALVSIGCCYNLLSEDGYEETSTSSGFPMSNAAKLSHIVLGKSIRDLACQSAERWRSLTEDIAQQNFDVHAFRAAFQMVLEKYFPELSRSSPSIGRQGKALRRQRLRRIIESQIGTDKITDLSCSSLKNQNKITASSLLVQSDDLRGAGCCNHMLLTDDSCANSQTPDPSIFRVDMGLQDNHLDQFDKFTLFKDFTESGLGRLGCGTVQDTTLLEIWRGVQPFTELIGPFWCLRAALGPVVETYILLDRLLFLQEHGSEVEALLFPLFDPNISPRNVAIVARKMSADSTMA